MSTRNSGVMRVARAVANGEGDWAEVPSAVRDAIVLAITQSSVTPLRHLESSEHGGYGTGALTTTPPLHLSSAASPAVLTEGNVQSGIQTFEDAAWLRDEAVRSYAEFHNNVESLHAAMRTQLHPVWKTSMQLRPGMLAEVRSHFKLNRLDTIPDDVPITAAAAAHIAQQEMILDEVEDTLQLLRNTSVRFAAHYLSDEEKISMGANPAYLRAPDIDREVVESLPQSAAPLAEEEVALRRRASESRPRHTHESGLIDSKANRRGHRGSHTNAAAAAADAAGAAGASHAAHLHIDGDRHRRRGKEKDRRRSSADNAVGAPSSDPLLEELRQQYQQRVRELEKQPQRPSVPPAEGLGSTTWPQVGSLASSRTSRSSSS